MLEHIQLWWLVPIALCFTVSNYLYTYLVTQRELRDIPGPFLARFSRLWLFLGFRRHTMLLDIDDAHRRMGKMVRIQPNHVSIADESAIPIVYGHGSGTLKT